MDLRTLCFVFDWQGNRRRSDIVYNSRGRTTAFTCRACRKERNVSENREAGPVNCDALFAVDASP
jgi:hypothetical protein